MGIGNKATREERLRSALRENLKRRKAQAKDRAKDKGRATSPGAEAERDEATEGSKPLAQPVKRAPS